MRSIKRSKAFKQDMKRERHGQYRFVLKEELVNVIEALAKDIPLDTLKKDYRDHALHRNLEGYRECHLRPDLILLYCKIDEELQILRLERLGSHRQVLGIE